VKRLIEFPLQEGGSIVVEVDEPEGGTVRVARPGEVSETAHLTFEQAVSKTKPAAERIIAMLRDLTFPPDEVGVEFGLNLNSQAGAFIASVSAQANFKVRLTWKREK
jgi:hypothetical protein